MDASEQLQQDHYNAIAKEYEAHYGDACSFQYRRRFIYEPMFEGLDLSGLNVLDAMCGGGEATEYLLSRNAKVTGLDISQEAIKSFKSRWVNCEASNRSLLDSGFPDDAFDVVVVIGGLHHMHPAVESAITEIHRVLKPGGYFCFMEPHCGSFPNLIRRIWYRYDRFFSDNEAAIDLTQLERMFDRQFEVRNVRFGGNLGFLFVLNSLIFRIPLRAKPFYSPLLMKLEKVFNTFQGKSTSCFAVAQWQKR